MSGQIKNIIDHLVFEKSKGNEIIASSVRTKLILKGINITKYTNLSQDDQEVIKKIRDFAKELGVNL